MRTRTYIERWLGSLLAGVALLTLAVAPASAQGWIEPGVNRGGLAVDKIRSEVTVRVEGRVALIEVSEWFENGGNRLAEGEYLYPLPGEAVFQGFSLFQGDAELRGEIMDAEQARGIYEEIVRRRADPALIELAGQGLLRARVFPFQPGETRKVTLRYTQVLERAGDALQLDYVGGVRGTGAHRSPDIAPHGGEGRRPVGPAADEGVETRFEVIVEHAEGFLDPFSPTHAISADRDGPRMTVSVDDDVVGRLAIFLPLAGDAVGMSVATHRPVGEDGYFMLTLSPDPAPVEVQPRDLTVVMDVSGSMSGEKIEQARQAFHQLLGTLAPADRFRLLAFSSAVRAEDRGWTAARGQGIERAKEWVDDLVADGGTNIEAALQEAFRLESPRDRLPVVVFLTDGLPSEGEQSPERLTRIAEMRAARARVFAFGVGHDVNTQLLDRLGEAGRGDTDYVEPGENVERALSLLAAKIRHPVLTDLELSGGPVEITEVYPVHIPDVFAGEELVLFGRYDGDGQAQLTVTGERVGRALEFSTEHVFPEDSDANGYIPRLWASRKLGHLERQVWTEGITESLAQEIRTLALRYGLPSRYTAYLVQEPGIVAAGPVDDTGGGRGGPLRSIGRLFEAGDAPVPAPTTGAAAVQAAESARRMRSTTSEQDLVAAERQLMDEARAAGADRPRQAIAGRIFELRDGVWTDVTFVDGDRVVGVKVYGPAWFDLIEAIPELEPVLRAHENVVIAGEGLSLHIGPEGVEDLDGKELGSVVSDFRGER